jgi:acyl-CoA synthetase (AMP-forming)/AMP-acid ligase II
LLQDSLLRTAQSAPGKTAIVSGEDRIDYSTLCLRSVQMANALKARGVARGDRVLIYLDNTWECAVSLYGTMLADALFVLVNPQTKSEKLAYILRDSGARVLLAEPALLRQVQAAFAQLEASPVLLVAGSPATGGPGESLQTAWETASATPPVPANIALDLVALIYTSGSTGEPKGVMHTHQSMRFALESLVEYLHMNAQDRIVCMLPLAFDYGLYQLLMAVHTGATLLLERSFAYPAQIFKLLENERITVFPGVPTVYSTLLSADERSPLRFPDVRKVTNTAAALPASFNRRLQAIFPNADIYRMYGLTECKRVCYLDPALIEEKPESVGKAIPGTETLLLDDLGLPVMPGQAGKLYVRGPHVMLGYWQQPHKTAQMLHAGPTPGERMLCTQDYFTADADGCLYFVGRSDNIIKSRGEKVSPVEVETVLYSLQGVREAAVLGVPDALLGQAIHAVVSLNEGADLDATKIRKLCTLRLENHMVPSHVLLLPELPKSVNGKIDNKILLNMLTESAARNSGEPGYTTAS